MMIRSAIVLAAVLAAGCSSTPLTEAPLGTEARPGTASRPAPPGPHTSSDPVVRVPPATAQRDAQAPTERTVYFEFDSASIRDQDKPLLEAHARHLAANRAAKARIEGHCDERGGREYNLALGQRRAETVLKTLQLQGASEASMEAVSFGKERPAATGHDDAAWARNRRAEVHQVKR
ncbi:peptidoglycan-associated lipoprotein Pal [Aquincola sp. S2]|uniref:Peptidoglycan-associated lipoprotein n=1 Tax=Pseudaquabacterium terrae TaxID=2732868 RepID=A0ABX2EQU5_9BURK|nr:peptidoglycan-associated lipoprotein Pal [Aquabacterium terrae]NRF71001.1 peptidoglycan-associated lipoprotein Pal [Aquabacterium terrae]